MQNAVIIEATRTAIGKLGGSLQTIEADFFRCSRY